MTGFSSSPLRLVLLGPPASGKGTQGRKLANILNLAYLSTGALLRDAVENESDLGKLARPILARGGYLPDEWMCGVLANWLARHDGGWVLDGFPRSEPQACFLDDLLAKRGIKLDAAILLDAPLAVLLARMQHRLECPDCRWSGQTSEASADQKCPDCGLSAISRPDDREENFINRYQEFLRLTRPLVAYYQERNLLCSCDATAPRDEVTADLFARFNPASDS